MTISTLFFLLFWMVKIPAVDMAGAAIRKTRGSCREQLFLDVPLEREAALCFLPWPLHFDAGSEG